MLRLLGEQPVEIDRKVREVLPELEEVEAGVLVDVPLAHFHEPAGGRQRGEPFPDRLAGQRVEDDVDPLALRSLADLVGEGEGPRVEDLVDPQGAEVLTLLGAAGGCEDLRAEVAGDLDRREADTAGGRVDEDPLTRLQPGQLDERDVRRHESDRHGRRRLEIQGRGLGKDEVCGCGDVRGHGAVGDRDHLVAEGEAFDSLAHGRNGAGVVETDAVGSGQLGQSELGEQPHGEHDVAEVEACCGDFDLHLAGSGIPRRTGAMRTLSSIPGVPTSARNRSPGAASRIVGMRSACARRRRRRTYRRSSRKAISSSGTR